MDIPNKTPGLANKGSNKMDNEELKKAASEMVLDKLKNSSEPEKETEESSDMKALAFIYRFMLVIGLLGISFACLGTIVAFLGWAWRLF